MSILHHIRLARVGQRLLARRLTGAKNAFAAPDEMTVWAAQAMRVGFFSFQDEQYDLVIPAEFLNAAPVQSVLDIAVSSSFQTELEALGGYNSSHTGTVVAEISVAL